MIIPQWGEQGQEKLLAATVFIAGAGGLGSPVAIFLAAAGIGTIRICDCGEPELSNLNRQILHSESDLGRAKTESAQASLHNINPHCNVVPLHATISDDTIKELAGDSSIIIDCLDNFTARHVLNRHAVKYGLPLVHAGIHGLSGQVTFIQPPQTPCLACIFPGDVPNEIFPVVGVTPGIIGCIEACEALKWLTGIGELLCGKLLIWEGDTMNFQKITINKDPNCPVCGNR
ncbi:MAG: HesA/MoeB/ThiF family protein [Deltaproteobacteria bacterium]|nr:HesA/MoeB/ThiF family protein [Deltaproteobacteria bacterium]